PRPTTKEWGEDRGEGWPPPLPGPLLHRMEERECRVAASPRCAVSQVFNLPPAGGEQRSADCKSAVRQIKNLRYAKQIRLSALLSRHFLNPPCLWRLQLMISLTTRPCTSVRRKSRPA